MKRLLLYFEETAFTDYKDVLRLEFIDVGIRYCPMKPALD